jgi:hypothetical protein
VPDSSLSLRKAFGLEVCNKLDSCNCFWNLKTREVGISYPRLWDKAQHTVLPSARTTLHAGSSVVP